MKSVRPCFLVAAAALCPVLYGCQLAYFLTPEKGHPVKAEYTKLEKKEVAVVVWADRPTLDIDPHARRRIRDAVLYDMKKHLTKTQFIASQQVEDFQERSGMDWERMNNQEVCQKLKCDILMRIDLLDYTTRGSEARELRKGRVKGTVNLYECEGGGPEESVYQTEVTSTYPTETEKHVTDLNDGELLREAIAQFGQAVGQKFYDHEESYHGRQKK
jgi:hypothetical protein